MGRRESRTWREEEWRGKEKKIKNPNRVESERTLYSYWNWQTLGRRKIRDDSSLISHWIASLYTHLSRLRNYNDNSTVRYRNLNIGLLHIGLLHTGSDLGTEQYSKFTSTRMPCSTHFAPYPHEIRAPAFTA